jgi:hypothetical protein
MRCWARTVVFVGAMTGCSGDPAAGKAGADGTLAKVPDAKVPDAKVPDAKVPDAKVPDAKVPDAKVPDAKTPDAKVPDAKVPDAKTPDATPAVDPVSPPTPPEIAIAAWAATDHAPTWTPGPAPAEALVLVDLDAGVLGRADAKWLQLDASGALVEFAMSTPPKPPILGVWPSDAWFVDTRARIQDEWEVNEIRLMKLRGGDRWVPQVYGGDQWFHPGTDDELEPHMSTRSGMLVYSASLPSITRVAGRHAEPTIGPHRGRAIDLLETGGDAVYVLSQDDAGVYAQTACEDEVCVAASARMLPSGTWEFGRRVARGKHSVSVVAISGARDFLLHHRGKSDGWLLDELPAGERPTWMWASQEGGLWTRTAERIRWRDTEGAWREITLPQGLSTPSVALTEDRTQVWVSGVVDGAPKIFTTPANAPSPTP